MLKIPLNEKQSQNIENLTFLEKKLGFFYILFFCEIFSAIYIFFQKKFVFKKIILTKKKNKRSPIFFSKKWKFQCFGFVSYSWNFQDGKQGRCIAKPKMIDFQSSEPQSQNIENFVFFIFFGFLFYFIFFIF